MNKENFIHLLDQTHETLVQLTKTKGEEYSRDSDQLANFKRYAADNRITPQQAWGVLFGKHSDAIQFFIQSGKQLSEPIESRIDDAILYLILLKAIIREV